MKRPRRLFVAHILALLLCVAWCVTVKADEIEAVRVEGPVNIDGKLDESCWTGAKFTSFPSAGGDSAIRTEFAFARNKGGLFVAFRCY